MKNKQHIEDYIQMHREAFEDHQCLPEYQWDTLQRTLTRVQGDTIAQFAAINRTAFDTKDCPDNVWNNIISALDKKIPPATKTDDLESFIQQHRDDFDAAVPDLKVWEQLANRKKPMLTIGWTQHLMRSAAAIALLIAGVGIGMWYSSQEQQRLAGMRMSEVSSEYAEIENHFERDIESKKQHLAQFTSQPSSADVLSDLSQMDKVMEELRLELANVPPGNREEVVRAMIENYKTKAKVLERVLKALEEHHTNNNNDADQNDQNSSNSNDHENVRI
jgi:hypothetical protein